MLEGALHTLITALNSTGLDEITAGRSARTKIFGGFVGVAFTLWKHGVACNLQNGMSTIIFANALFVFPWFKTLDAKTQQMMKKSSKIFYFDFLQHIFSKI